MSVNFELRAARPRVTAARLGALSMLLARVFVWSGGFCLDERVFIWVRGFYLGGCQEKGYSLFKLSRLVASDGFCSLRVQLCVVGKNFLQVLDAWVLANTPFA